MRACAVALASLAMAGCTVFQPARSLVRRPSIHVMSKPLAFRTAGRVERRWYVPAGTGDPEVVIGSVRRDTRCRLTKVSTTGHCHTLTVWRRDRPGNWTPTTLFDRSPFPFQATSVRTADVTGDGHRDLLVTVECSDCNHAAATAAVYADVGGRMRRIYGSAFYEWYPGVGVPGRPIVETAWGAQRGLVWFDLPHYGRQSSICCPDYRVQTFLRWSGGHWRTVRSRRVSPDAPYLDRRPVPAP